MIMPKQVIRRSQPFSRLPVGSGASESPVFDKSSNNGIALTTKWPDTDSSLITSKNIQQAVVTSGPAGIGSDVVYVQTTDSGMDRTDIVNWTGIQDVGTSPLYTGSPFRTGTDWWFSTEIFLPSTDVTAGAVNAGHWAPASDGGTYWLWQMHHDFQIQNSSDGVHNYTQVPVVFAVDYNGGSPRWFFRFIGGNCDFGPTDTGFGQATGNKWCSYAQNPPNVVLDTWHRFVLHGVLSDDPAIGYWEVWMNGSKIIDMTGTNVISGWTKTHINSSGSFVSISTESKMATMFYRTTTPNNNGDLGGEGNLYPALDCYHTTSTTKCCVLHREAKYGHSLSSVGGI